ncbi:MAG TPA: hypothetical protein VJT73_11790 [Polyangiaceae bacterium]|nr:hypothetical protein [Polyangiaceae bacterium]
MSSLEPLRRFCALLACVLAPACTESPQSIADYSAVAVLGGGAETTIGDWQVTLSRAEFAFGPVYFCAAASGSPTLCQSSVAELITVTTVDSLATTPVALGTVHGFTGPIRSASYDYGISWFETQSRPGPLPGAPSGHSVVLGAEARRGAEVIPIFAKVDVTPQSQGYHAVQTAPVSADVTSSHYRLEVEFDVAGWLGQLDLDDIAKTSERPFAIEPGDDAHSALLIGIRNLSPPVFRWVPLPP